MTEFFKKLSPEWALRFFTGIMYLYSGQDLLASPTAWHWALPYWLRQTIMSIMPLDTYLRLQGVVELLLAAALLGWFIPKKYVRWVALLSTLEMAVILLLTFFPWSETNFTITFRDIGLLGGSLALTLLLWGKTDKTEVPAVV